MPGVAEKTIRIRIRVDGEADTWPAYPAGSVKGVIVGQDSTAEAALDELASAIIEHVETFGLDVLEGLDAEDLQHQPNWPPIVGKLRGILV